MFSLNCIKICQLSSDRVSIHIVFSKLSSKLNSRNIIFISHKIVYFAIFCSRKNFVRKKKLLFRKCPHLCKRKLKWDFTMFVESKNQRFSVVIIKSRKLIKSLQAIRFVSKQFFNKSDISACENHMMFKLMRIFFTYFAKIKLIIIFSFRFPSVFHFPHNHCGIMCLLLYTYIDRMLFIHALFACISYICMFYVLSCALLACVPYFFSHTFHIYATSMRFICYTHTYLLCLHGFHISTAFMISHIRFPYKFSHIRCMRFTRMRSYFIHVLINCSI